jgi:hypothetical protein
LYEKKKRSRGISRQKTRFIFIIFLKMGKYSMTRDAEEIKLIKDWIKRILNHLDLKIRIRTPTVKVQTS